MTACGDIMTTHDLNTYVAKQKFSTKTKQTRDSVSSIGRFLEPPFRSQEPFPLPPAILDDVTSVSGSGNGSWLLNGGSKNLPVFRLSGHMYIGMSPLAQVDQIPWPGDRQTVECGQHLGTWWRVCHFFFFFFFFLTVLCNSLELLHSTVS